MSSGPSTCPFCNAVLPPVPSPPSTEKLPCPRCGEPVAASHWQVATDAVSPPPRANLGDAATRRRTALVLIGIMVLMAVTGLAYALYTVKLRQSRHPRPREIPPVMVHSPEELPALGYLPPEAAIVGGIQVAALAEDPVGKILLEAPYPPVIAQASLLLKSAGLKIEDLDHAAVAMVEGKMFPDIVFVARTRVPYDLEKLSQATQPARASVYQKRPRFDFPWLPLGAVTLWAADEHTLVYVLRLTDDANAGAGDQVLRGLALPPRTASEVLAPALRQLIEDRIPRHSLLWLVGDFENKAFKLTKDLPLPKPRWLPLDRVQRFGVGALPLEGLTVIASLLAKDEKSAAEMQALFEKTAPPAGVTLKVQGPPPGEAWVMVQWRADAEGVRRLVAPAK
jgi:hypothetical protein